MWHVHIYSRCSTRWSHIVGHAPGRCFVVIMRVARDFVRLLFRMIQATLWLKISRQLQTQTSTCPGMMLRACLGSTPLHTTPFPKTNAPSSHTRPRRLRFGFICFNQPLNLHLQITSPGYPNAYGEHLNCLYKIRVSKGHRVELRFNYAITEAVHDFIEVFDGEGTDGVHLYTQLVI